MDIIIETYGELIKDIIGALLVIGQDSFPDNMLTEVNR